MVNTPMCFGGVIPVFSLVCKTYQFLADACPIVGFLRSRRVKTIGRGMLFLSELTSLWRLVKPICGMIGLKRVLIA